MLVDIFPNKAPYNLGRGQVMLGADLFQNLLLCWIDQNGQTGGALFQCISLL